MIANPIKTGHRHRRVFITTPVLAILATVSVLVAVPASASASAQTECEEQQKTNGNSTRFFPVPAEVAKRTLTSVVLAGQIRDVGCETKWSIAWSTSPSGPWSPFPGGSGTVPGVDPVVVAAPFETGELTGLEPETTYYDRGTAKNVLGVREEYGTFEAKLLRPSGVGVEPSSIGETTVRLEGSIEPAPFETHWRIEYSAGINGPWTLAGEGVISQAEAEALQTAVGAESTHPKAEINGLSPSNRYYARIVTSDEPEWPPSSGKKHHKEVTNGPRGFETHGRPVAEASGTPALRLGSLRVLGYVVPNGFDTHYHFDYGLTAAYGSQTPEEDAGSGGSQGNEASVAAADLPGLLAGKTYHYRIVAVSPAAGGTVRDGGDHTLTVPVPAGGSEAAACPNQVFRTGASAGLPACRAFEQVTPVDKEGAEEPFSSLEVGAVVGEDGDHAMLFAPFTKWGSGQSPYFFSRGGSGWSTTAGTPQPEAGVEHYEPELFSPDLTSFAFAAAFETSHAAQSPSIDLRAGAPGGPYASVASVPREQLGDLKQSGWVAASADFSKLIAMVEDHAVVPGHPSSTKSGADLYEYAGGGVRQVNVLTGGATIGVCGATMVIGHGEQITTDSTSSPHAVSGDGSRVFFYATPGVGCSGATHLFMRVNGGQPDAETVDIGPYNFLAANAAGSEILLEVQTGENDELLLYKTASATTELLVSLREPLTGGTPVLFDVSEDLSTIYIQSREALTPEAPPVSGNSFDNSLNLYRYDRATKTLRFVANALNTANFMVTPDGRYASWYGRVAGLPSASRDGVDAILYDSVQNLVECVSCASSFNPEPKIDVSRAYLGVDSVLPTRDGMPKLTLLSADGSRVFFDIPSALLPSDIDGELEPHGNNEELSPSSDIYEWRRNGLEGCTQVQGCLGLVTSGRGGGFVLLLGADPSGENVFFTTRESLLSQDNDTALDIYDARTGGGFPSPPARPVECEGDACSTPFAAPSDLTPSTSTFQGAGNVLGAALPVVKAKPKAKAKSRCKAKAKKKCKAKARKRASAKHARKAGNHRRGR
jgi:hypothetical protein